MAPNPRAAAKAAANASPVIRAYHGSPHRFDRFDAQSIGSGEGNQSFGHGLYFAQNESVADYYRRMLSSQEVPDEIQNALDSSQRQAMDAAREARRAAGTDRWDELLAAYKEAEAKFKAAQQQHAKFAVARPGHMYEVEIARPESSLLDWNARVSAQSPEIQEAVRSLLGSRAVDLSGAKAYDDISHGWGDGMSDAKASQLLQEQGIPGIRYWDAGSRSGGSGTRNFVIFPGEEHAIRILRQYGWIPPAMAAVDSVVGTGSGEANAAPKLPISDGVLRFAAQGAPAAFNLGTAAAAAMAGSSNTAQGAPKLPLSNDVLRSAMPWQTQRKIARLTKQVDAAYESGDFKTAEKLDAQREQLVDDWDNKFEQMDDGDGNVDYEPENYEYERTNYNDDLIQVYGDYLAGRIEEEDLPGALRGSFHDQPIIQSADEAYDGYVPNAFSRSEAIPDEEIVAYAKDAFEKRQAHLAKVRSATPEDGVRAMQAKLRDMPAGLMAAPLMGQAQGVNENRELPAGSGGTTRDLVRGVIGDFDFSMAISPEEWAAHQQRQQAGEVSPDLQQFKQNVAAVMNQPIIRVAAANDGSLASDGRRGLLVDGDDNARITPAQFVGEYLDVFAPRLPAEERGKVMGEVMARLEGSTGQVSQVAEQAIGRMMASLKASSPGGKYAKAEPISEQQLAEWRQQYGDQADWMLSPGSAEDFQSQAGYELLRTMQDGEHAPSYANTLSSAVSVLSGGSPDRGADFYVGDAITARAKEANRLAAARAAQPTDRPPAFRDANGKPLYSDWDTRTLTGLTKAGGDTSSWQGQMTMPMYRFFSEWNRNPIGRMSQLDSDSEWAKATGGKPWSLSAHYQAAMAPWNTTQDRDQHIERTQQVIKDGMTPEEFRQQIALNRADAEKRESYESSFYPQFQRAWDRVTGDKTPRTWGTPAFEMGAQFLRKSVDSPIAVAASVPFAGANVARGIGAAVTSKSLIGALKEAGKGLGKGAASAAKVQFGDIPSDLATDQGVTAGILGSNYWRAMTTPYADNALMGDVQPDDPNLDQKREGAEQQRQDEWFQGMRDWNMTPREREYSRWKKSQRQ